MRAFVVAAVALTCLTPQIATAEDAAAGETVFKRCASCHAVGEDAKNKVGPHLNDLFGRQAGTVEGFKYSQPMIDAGAGGLIWTPETSSTSSRSRATSSKAPR
jgi:cytochrome c2